MNNISIAYKQQNLYGKLASVIWLLIGVYLFLNIALSLPDEPKELLDKYPESYAEKLEEWKSSPITKVREIMIPAWRYNRYIYPLTLIVAFIFTFKWMSYRKSNASNKSLKHGTPPVGGAP